MVQRRSGSILRFGPYEFDPAASDLRKHGVRLKLQGQPLQLLSALLEEPGEIVSREALRQRLWPADTFVDFESGLNTVAKRLRTALSDSADQPVYIETIARTGYRFIAPVTSSEPAPEPITLPDTPAPPQADRRQWLAYAGVATAAAAAGFVLRRPTKAPRWHFRQLTFRQGDVTSARFAPDGQSIVYAGQFDLKPKQIYMNNGVSPESRPLGLSGYSLFSISRRGELALNRFGGTMPIRGGTLEKVPVNGGTPSVADHDITSADWAPDGSTLALVRAVDGATRLEYPPGHVLYNSTGWLSSLRIAPDANHLAFIEHPIRHDDAGTVRIVDRQGKAVGQTGAWDVAGGLAWRTPDELWFSASRGNHPKSLWSCDLRGREQTLLTGPGILTLTDVRPDGRALVLRQSRRLEMAGSLEGAAPQDLSWHDWSRVADLSVDGRYLLFEETGEAAGAGGAVYLRDTDSGGIKRLADGYALCLSPTARHALIVRREDRTKLLLVPIGGGAVTALKPSGLEYQWARFYPDGRHLFALGGEKGTRGLRIYKVDVDNGSKTALTPPGMVRHAALSRDGKQLAVLAADGKLLIYPADQPGAAAQVPANIPYGPIAWRADNRHLFAQPLDVYTQVPATVLILDTQTGRTQPWKETGPANPMGVNSVTRVMISQDEYSWVCNYRRALSELFQITPEA